MNTQQRRTQLTRIAIAGAFLLAGLVTTVETTLAGPPYVDAGGPAFWATRTAAVLSEWASASVSVTSPR